MKIKTELVGGVLDGKSIILDGATLPMQIKYPYYPSIQELLDVVNEVPTDNPEESLSGFKTITYTLQSDGTYKEESK